MISWTRKKHNSHWASGFRRQYIPYFGVRFLPCTQKASSFEWDPEKIWLHLVQALWPSLTFLGKMGCCMEPWEENHTRCSLPTSEVSYLLKTDPASYWTQKKSKWPCYLKFPSWTQCFLTLGSEIGAFAMTVLEEWGAHILGAPISVYCHLSLNAHHGLLGERGHFASPSGIVQCFWFAPFPRTWKVKPYKIIFSNCLTGQIRKRIPGEV